MNNETTKKEMNISLGVVHDVGRNVSPSMTVYVKDPKPRFEKYYTLKRDKVNVTRIILGSHTGTHVDAPSHFLPKDKSIDEEPLSKFIGEAVVIDLSKCKTQHNSFGITDVDLEQYSSIVNPNDILLLNTGTGKRLIRFAYLEISAARWILANKIKSVGIDTLSIEKYGSKDAPVHKLLLSHKIGIIENLNNLLKFVNKRMFLVCLPLPLRGVDGSPARAILLEMIK